MIGGTYDVEDWATWRLAELRSQGIDAQPVVIDYGSTAGTFRAASGQRLMGIGIRHGGRVEDPFSADSTYERQPSPGGLYAGDVVDVLAYESIPVPTLPGSPPGSCAVVRRSDGSIRYVLTEDIESFGGAGASLTGFLPRTSSR
jgi:hypothetical protein